MNSGKVILGILAGASAGALLGILFAPRTGKDTRKEIAKTGKKYADGMKVKFDENLDIIKKKLDKVRKEVSEIADHARAKEEKLKNDYGVEIN